MRFWLGLASLVFGASTLFGVTVASGSLTDASGDAGGQDDLVPASITVDSSGSATFAVHFAPGNGSGHGDAA